MIGGFLEPSEGERAEDLPSATDSLDSFLAEVARLTTRSGTLLPLVTPGVRIADRYRAVRPLGRGAHGVVWAVFDELAGREAALKLLVAESTVDAARARAEIGSLRRLRSAGVVRLLDEGVEGGCLFLVMPLVDGRPFPGVPSPAPWERIARATELLLETLAEVHAAGFVHRDLKPSNVLVDAIGRPTVLDFGLTLSPVFGEADVAGRILGTPAYLAPEQSEGGAVDARADLHAVGVMLFRALSARFPHEAPDVRSLLAAKRRAPPPLRDVAPAVAPAVAEAVDALLATSPADRPETAHAALDLLRGRPTVRALAPRPAPANETALLDATNDPMAFAASVSSTARALAAQGQLDRASRVLSDGLTTLRRNRSLDREPAEEILPLWVEVALAEATPLAFDHVLYELCKIGPISPLVAQLEALVRAALAVGAWTERALDLASSMTPFESPALERLRQSVRVMAARRTSLAREIVVIEELSVWAERANDPAARAALAGWLGRLRYRQGRYAEAAALHLEAARGAGWLTAQAAALVSSASSFMEAFRLDEAMDAAERALSLSRKGGHVFGQLQAEWTARNIAYRRGAALEPDEASIDAAARLGIPELEALFCATEGAIAWRRGELDRACVLALRGRDLWTLVGERGGGRLLLAALVIACRGPEAVGEIDDLVRTALSNETAGIGIQALGLIAPHMGPGLVDTARVRALAQTVPTAHWQDRLDALSVDEALARLAPLIDIR